MATAPASGGAASAPAAVVPEPGTIGLLLLGGLIPLPVRRPRNRRRAA